MRRMRRLIGCVLIAGVAGCGGGGGSSPVTPTTTPPTTTPPAAVRTVLDTRTFTVPRNSAIFLTTDNIQAGAVDVVVEWVNGDSTLHIYVTDTLCTGADTLLAGGCRVFATAAGTEKPKRVTFDMPQKGNRVTWVVNPGGITQQGQMQLGLTTQGPLPPDPTGTPNPTNDPREGKAPGPVITYIIKVRSIGEKGNPSTREPFQKGGCWIVHPGEFLVFDSTPKNAAGDDCVWKDDPKWKLQDPTDILYVLNSSNPFLLRTDVTKNKGEMTLYSTIDGVESNTLRVCNQ